MIKNLLDADDIDSTETKKIVEDDMAQETAAEEITAPDFSELNDAENLLEIPDAPFSAPNKFAAAKGEINFELPVETKSNEAEADNSGGTLFQASAAPESIGETARQSGLAYGAAITLFGSVVFMLIIGWGADLLLGTPPWGIVAGIALGAIIGFFQFFRITSQIFKK